MKLAISDADRKMLLEFLQDLVRLPSPSTEEHLVAQRLSEEMRAVGFPDVSVDRMGNVIGHLGHGGGVALCYNGHMDTVHVSDASLWKHEPLGAQIDDGVLYGLGAADMKSSLAAMVYGVKALIDSGLPIKGDLYVVGVVQEEPCEGLAMRMMMEEKGLRPDMVVLGEPTNLHLARGHRGRLGLRIRIRGQAAHASAPQRGRNAIHDAAKVIVAVQLLAPQLAHNAFMGQGTIAITDISSKAASLNAIPDICEMYVDRRLTMGETEAKALAELKHAIAREHIPAEIEIAEYSATSYTRYPCQSRESFPAWALPENAPLAQTCASVIEQLLGFRPDIGRWDFSTDGAYTAGVAGLPTIGFGPGEERFAHAADERVSIESVWAAAQVYANLPLALLR